MPTYIWMLANKPRISAPVLSILIIASLWTTAICCAALALRSVW